jgi:beta-lactamase class A
MSFETARPPISPGDRGVTRIVAVVAAMILSLAKPDPAIAWTETASAAQATEKLRPNLHPSSNAAGNIAYDALVEQISRIALVSKGQVGVAAIDLRTNARVEYNATEAVSLASTFKVPLAVYAMHLAEDGKLSLSEPISVAREDMIEPGVLYDHFRHAGTAISTLNAIELSVSISDNSATDVVFRRVGGPGAANAWLRAKGYPQVNVGSQLLKDLFAQSSSPGALPPPARSTLLPSPTPRAVVDFLADLHRGRIINEEHTAILLDIMSRTSGERISAQLPPGVKVLHKTGTNIGGGYATVNDIGYIQMPDGGWMAIAVYIKQSPLSVSHNTRDKIIGGISRSIYDYFTFGPERGRGRAIR